MGWSRPTNMPIQSRWSLSQCPVLLDSGACVPMPFLMSLKALDLSCPGVTIDPLDPATPGQLSAANGSSLELIGSVNLHFRFSGPSVGRDESREWAMSGPVMQYWYPACAAIFRNLSTPYIMSASLLCTHVMQISYADMSGPTATFCTRSGNCGPMSNPNK